MNQTVQNIKQNIDWTTVTSMVVASVIIGGLVYASRKAGLGQVATVVKGG